MRDESEEIMGEQEEALQRDFSFLKAFCSQQ